MIRIQVWADFVCPYSYIGINNLYAAIENLQLKQVRIDYAAYLKYPFVHTNASQPLSSSVSDKYGISEEDAQQYMELVKNVANENNLMLQLERLSAINTLKAHRLGKLAAIYQLQDSYFRRMFHAYFVDAVSLNDDEQLRRIGEEVGLPAQEVEQVLLNSAMYEAEVEEDHFNGQRLEVVGTPYFIINDEIKLAGMQSIAQFEEVLMKF